MLLGDILGFLNSGRAANSISNANIAAEHGVLGAVEGGNAGIQNAVAGGQAGVNNAVAGGQAGVNGALTDANSLMNNGFTNAYGEVNNGVGNANAGLGSTLQSILQNTQGYQQAGAQGAQGLQDFVANNPKFQFSPDQYMNSDAYKFQLKQGQDAIQNTMSAQGLGNSGAAAKELTNYGQGLASTYYNDAFNHALQTYNTNTGTSLAGLNALTGLGEFGTNQANQAQTLIGGQQAQNTANAGLWGGNQQMNLSQILSQLGMQGAEFNGQMGQQGAEFNSSTGLQGAESGAHNSLVGSELAGNFAVGAGTAHAGGIMGQGNAIAGGINDIGQLLMMLGGG